MVSQPTLEPLRRWDPERIGPFTVLGRLGAGAMGQVYLGRSTAGRLVAVKTIKIEFAEEAGFRTRFAHEVAAARRVSGVFTAAVVAADPDADVPWLATAYVPAPSLQQLVRATGPLPVPAVRWLAAGCAEALESIHNAGLVHRDLKPSNVLVAPDGPRVIDFGVARAAERIQLTVTRGAVGTPAYMAPEQARDTRQASVASDMFSLGATLLFAATGHPPYQGDTVMDVLVRLATEAPDIGGLPAELTGLVTACLDRAPRHRPTSAALLATLAPFVQTATEAESGHPYLTGPEIALIDEYQRNPQPPPRDDDAVPGDGESSDDATFGSHTALGPRNGIAPRRWRRRTRSDQGGPGRGGPLANPRARPRKALANPRARPRRALTTAGLIGGGAVLAVAGVAAGVAYQSAHGQPGADRPTATPSTSAPAVAPIVLPPGNPPNTLPSGTSKKPELVLSQPYGDGHTVFVIHGSGFVPLTPVRIELVGVGFSPDRPVADQKGTFNYAIDQGHVFYRGLIPLGLHKVIALGTGGRRASVTFQVLPMGPSGGALQQGG
jgi:serine/threonine protein kinase